MLCYSRALTCPNSLHFRQRGPLLFGHALVLIYGFRGNIVQVIHNSRKLTSWLGLAFKSPIGFQVSGQPKTAIGEMG